MCVEYVLSSYVECISHCRCPSENFERSAYKVWLSLQAQLLSSLHKGLCIFAQGLSNSVWRGKIRGTTWVGSTERDIGLALGWSWLLNFWVSNLSLMSYRHMCTDHSWKTCKFSWSYPCPSLAWHCHMDIVLPKRILRGSHVQGCIESGARQEPDEQVVGDRELWLVLWGLSHPSNRV